MTQEVLPHGGMTEEQKNGQLEDKHESDTEEARFLEPLSSVHFIILDWTSANFIDSVGAKAIKQVPLFYSLFLSGLWIQFSSIITFKIVFHTNARYQCF